MARPTPKNVQHVSCIGTGLIGGGWVAHFLAQGYDGSVLLPHFGACSNKGFCSNRIFSLSPHARSNSTETRGPVFSEFNGCGSVRKPTPP